MCLGQRLGPKEALKKGMASTRNQTMTAKTKGALSEGTWRFLWNVGKQLGMGGKNQHPPPPGQTQEGL